MAESLIVKNKRDITVTLSDFGDANSLEIAFESGDVSQTIGGTSVDEYQDRGRRTSPPSIRLVDDQTSEVSFSAYLRDVADASYATLLSVLNNFSNGASAWVSRNGATADVKTLKTTIKIDGIANGDPSDHYMVWDYCYYGQGAQVTDGSPLSISATATIYQTYGTLT